MPPTASATKSGGHSGLPPHAEDDVTRAQEFIRERGIEADTKILNGDPADLLVGEAAEGGYDVAVVGSRGLGIVAGLFLGSVSRKLVKRMPCPVIVAGPDKVERHEPALAAKREIVAVPDDLSGHRALAYRARCQIEYSRSSPPSIADSERVLLGSESRRRSGASGQLGGERR